MKGFSPKLSSVEKDLGRKILNKLKNLPQGNFLWNFFPWKSGYFEMQPFL